MGLPVLGHQGQEKVFAQQTHWGPALALLRIKVCFDNLVYRVAILICYLREATHSLVF